MDSIMCVKIPSWDFSKMHQKGIYFSSLVPVLQGCDPIGGNCFFPTHGKTPLEKDAST